MFVAVLMTSWLAGLKKIKFYLHQTLKLQQRMASPLTSIFLFQVHLAKKKLIKTVGRPNDLGQAKIFNYDVKAVAPERDADFILVFDDYNHKSNVTSETKAAALKDLSGSAEVVTYSDLLDKKFLLNN